MTYQIQAGPPVMTINQGRTFMVTSPDGMIRPGSNQGLYAIDTRFVSFYQLYLNRVPLDAVNASQLTFYASRFHLTNPTIQTDDGTIEAQTVSVTINRTIHENLHEEIEVTNYSGKPIHSLLEVSIRSDFADLFEVRANKIVQHGQIETTWDASRHRLYTSYSHDDFKRSVSYQLNGCPTQPEYANGRLSFEIALEQNETCLIKADLLLEHDQSISSPVSEPEIEVASTLKKQQAIWQNNCSSISTPNTDLDKIYQQAIIDMGAMRLYDMDVSEEAWVPAAGVPWFVTLFGRDSLLVSYQNMLVSPDFARGVLKRLADLQASERDDWRDAQPGKILHELRAGELAHFHTVPFYPYYGTADATILFLIVLSEAYRWTGDKELIKEFQQNAENCLDWIDHFGDLDGDGFQEYKTFSSPGYENLGWKDAGDAVVYANGSQVKQPKGTCELQGYVYDARLRMAEIFQALGDEAGAQALLQQAETLKRNFNKTFWLEDEGCYAFALDSEKKLVTSIASNAGQCLWSGIAEPEKAKRTAERLLQEDMFSGWGIRTLSSKNPAYNPFSYQRGSIWPHDNGLIAAGFKNYGLDREANQVIQSMLEAINRFESFRPPEVFAGLKRRDGLDFPVLYPAGANIPQAWATGSIFLMIRTILGLRADAPHRKLYVRPTLPDWLSELTLQRLRVGPCTLTLRFWREGSRSNWELSKLDADRDTPKEDMIEVVNDEECQAFLS